MRNRDVIRRLEHLETEGDSTETGIRYTTAEEWDGSSHRASGPGVALMSAELTVEAWANEYGEIEVGGDRQTEGE